MCVPVPFYHCFGMVIGNLACTSHGACVVVPGEAFDAGDTLATVEAERCTSLYGVPTMVIAQLNPSQLLQHRRLVAANRRDGRFALPGRVMKQVGNGCTSRRSPSVNGMTETSPCRPRLKGTTPSDKRVSSVGRVHPHVEIKIVSPDTDQTIPRGTSGSSAHGDTGVMLEYWNDPTSTAAAIDGNRWMHTGDLATMNAGRLCHDRWSDQRHESSWVATTSTRERSRNSCTRTRIEDAQVIGVPSATYGEEVMVWIKPKAGAHLTGETLATFCRARSRLNKIPRYWKVVDAFPMTVTGKVQKFRMRVAGHGRVRSHRRRGGYLTTCGRCWGQRVPEVGGTASPSGDSRRGSRLGPLECVLVGTGSPISARRRFGGGSLLGPSVGEHIGEAVVPLVTRVLARSLRQP